MTGLVSQGTVARLWGEEAMGGCRATSHGKKHKDFILSAMEDIDGFFDLSIFLSCPRAFAWGLSALPGT